MLGGTYRFVILLLRNFFISSQSEILHDPWSVWVCTVTPQWCLNMFRSCRRDTPKFLGIAQEGWYWNSLLPEDKYLKEICMGVEADPRRPSWFLHLSYEATEQWRTFLSGQPLSLMSLISCHSWQEAWATEGKEALFTLSSVQLNQFTDPKSSSSIVIIPAPHTCCKCTSTYAKHTDKS